MDRCSQGLHLWWPGRPSGPLLRLHRHPRIRWNLASEEPGWSQKAMRGPKTLIHMPPRDHKDALPSCHATGPWAQVGILGTDGSRALPGTGGPWGYRTSLT